MLFYINIRCDNILIDAYFSLIHANPRIERRFLFVCSNIITGTSAHESLEICFCPIRLVTVIKRHSYYIDRCYISKNGSTIQSSDVLDDIETI